MFQNEEMNFCYSKDYATVVGEMAPRLAEKAKLQN